MFQAPADLSLLFKSTVYGSGYHQGFYFMTLQKFISHREGMRTKNSPAEQLLFKHKGKRPEAKYNVDGFNLIKLNSGPVQQLFSRALTQNTTLSSEENPWFVAQTASLKQWKNVFV